jgi:hypothetical protein
MLGGKCTSCFSTKDIEVHHLVRVHRNVNSNFHDCFGDLINTWKTNKNGLVLKCKSCHNELNGRIPYEKINTMADTIIFEE